MPASYAHSMLVETYLLLDDGDHRVLSQFGLNPTQFALLKLLDLHDGRRPIELTSLLLLEKSSITRLIDRMEQEQLVQRVLDPDDRRAQRIILTPAGLERREQALAAHHQSLEQRLGHLSEDEQQALGSLLEKLCLQLRVPTAQPDPDE